MLTEARTHGVGYYAFSQDEEERAKQQKELQKLREETAQQQKSNAEQKQLREKQLAARLKAARNRKRTRMGLSPEKDGKHSILCYVRQPKPRLTWLSFEIYYIFHSLEL